MPDALKDLTRAINSLLKRMRLAEAGGTQRFGRWVYIISDAILPPMARVYAISLTKAGGKVEKDDAESIVRVRSIETARSICDTTTQWIMEGRDEDFIFSTARAAQIAVTEASWAVNAAKMRACHQRGKKIRWRLGGKACDICKRLNGRTITAGKQFISHNGIAVFGPPVHPNCKCKLTEVR